MPNMNMAKKMFEARQLMLSGLINSEMCDELMPIISALALDGVSDAQLHIDSIGGALESAFHLYDAIIASGICFQGVVIGKCMSAAVSVLQSCQVRHALPHAQFLVHETSRELNVTMARSGTLESYFEKVREAHSGVVSMDGKNDSILRSRLNSDRTLFEKLYETGGYFQPEDALEMGLIDGIVSHYSRKFVLAVRKEGQEAEGDPPGQTVEQTVTVKAAIHPT
jgi:ATP-dependent protease ClpP protease subunit